MSELYPGCSEPFVEGSIRCIARQLSPNDPTLYEDLCQEGRLAAWVACTIHRPETSTVPLHAFVLTTARYRMSNVARSDRRHSLQNTDDLVIVEQTVPAAGTPDIVVALHEVERRLASLSERDQAIVVSLAMGVDSVAVGLVVGLSASQIRRIAAAARRRLVA